MLTMPPTATTTAIMVLDTLNIAELSALHLTEEDWRLATNYAAERRHLHSQDCEAYIDFQWFEEDYSVRVSLGRVFAELEDDRALDYDVYLILQEAGFSSEFCFLIIQARREEFVYLVIDPEKPPTPGIKVLYAEIQGVYTVSA